MTYFTEFDPKEAKKHDIVYFQTYYLYRNFVSGPKYVWDLDDVIESEECNTKESRAERIVEVGRCFNSVDAVIFGSELLKDHYKDWYQGKSMVMIDYIDPCDHEAVNQQFNDGKIRIGFHGTDYYIPEVLDILPIITKLKEKYPIEFTVIGVRGAREEILKAGFNHIEHIPYQQFPYGLASLGLDIGIAHYRQDKEVNLPKNHLKFSEYAWLGVPCVASRWILGQFLPDRYYVPFVDLDGLKNGLEFLIKSENARFNIGDKARRYALSKFSLHEIVDKYKSFFRSLS